MFGIKKSNTLYRDVRINKTFTQSVVLSFITCTLCEATYTRVETRLCNVHMDISHTNLATNCKMWFLKVM